MLAGVSPSFVVWLVYVDVIISEGICNFRAVVHVTTFALLIVLALVRPAPRGWTRPRALTPGVQTH
ncbi:MAG: hypothetical protein ACYDB2_01450 [Acidimicrobiales bacterium]